MDNQLYFEYMLKKEREPDAPHWEEPLSNSHNGNHHRNRYYEELKYREGSHDYVDWADPDNIIENRDMQAHHRHNMRHEVFNREAEPQLMEPHVTNYSLIQKMKEVWDRTKAPIVEKMSWYLYTNGETRFMPNVVDTHAVLQQIQRSDKDGTVLLENSNKTESSYPEHALKLSRFDQTVKKFQEYVQETKAVAVETVNPSVLRQTVGQIQEQFQHTNMNKKIAREMANSILPQQADASQFVSSMQSQKNKTVARETPLDSAMLRTEGTGHMEDTSISMGLKPIASDINYKPVHKFNTVKLSAHMNDQLYETDIKRHRPIVEKAGAGVGLDQQSLESESNESRHTSAPIVKKENSLLRKVISQPLIDESHMNLHYKSVPTLKGPKLDQQHDMEFAKPSLLSSIKAPIIEQIRKFRGESHIMKTIQGQNQNRAQIKQVNRSKLVDIRRDEEEIDRVEESAIRPAYEPSRQRSRMSNVDFSHR